MFRKNAKTRNWSWMMLSLIVVGAVLVFVLSARATTSAVSAYNDIHDLNCRWAHTANTALEPKYEYHPVHQPEGQYLTAFSATVYDWNNSDTPVDFDYNTAQFLHRIGVQDMGDNGAYGYTTWHCLNFGKRSYTFARINSALVPEDSSYALKRSVATHELGHYIGVRHSTHAPAIMDIGRNRETTYQVKLDDECAVNDRYDHSSYPVDCNY